MSECEAIIQGSAAELTTPVGQRLRCLIAGDTAQAVRPIDDGGGRSEFSRAEIAQAIHEFIPSWTDGEATSVSCDIRDPDDASLREVPVGFDHRAVGVHHQR